jgi:hypothetical protein
MSASSCVLDSFAHRKGLASKESLLREMIADEKDPMVKDSLQLRLDKASEIAKRPKADDEIDANPNASKKFKANKDQTGSQ